MDADLVLLSARTLLDPATGRPVPGATALAAVNGAITAMGTDAEVRSAVRIGPRTEVVDLSAHPEATVLPGLVDGHTHPALGAAELAVGVDLSGAKTLDAVRAALAVEAERLAPGEWLRGWGLDPNVFVAARQPVAASSLGPVADQLPVALRLFDGHSMLAGPAALAAAGVDGPRSFDQAAEVVCDEHGRPTGLLLEAAAVDLVLSAAPRPTRAELRTRLRDTLRGMAAAGLTGGHVMDAGGDSLALYAELEESGELDLRLRVAPWCQPGVTEDQLAELVALQGTGGGLWTVAGAKFFIDGTVDNGTAWLEKPDCHGESRHAFWPDPQAFTAALSYLARAGVPTATHAIGDAAVRHVLDSLEAVGTADSAERHRHRHRHRHRIEHIETVPDEIVPRFARLGVAASMQPTHCCEYTRADHTDNWSLRLGEERASRAWRTRDLWDDGALVVLGSDWPIAPFPPLTVMAGARHRRPSDLSLPPHGPLQALTPLQALQGCTLNPAVVAGDSDRVGNLRIGHRADLTVLAADPLQVADTELAAVPVLLTALDGRVTARCV